jgi:hypothetical protein
MIAFSKATAPASGSAMRILQFVPGQLLGGWEEVTELVLPPATATDHLEANHIVFLDVDQDGDQDLIMLAPQPVGGGNALRILRNERVGDQVGIFRRTLDAVLQPVASGSDRFEGHALTIGDVTGDSLLDYLISGDKSSAGGSSTRIVKTDK